MRSKPTRYANLFTRARTDDGCAFCLCQTPPLRLVIRARTGRFHLAGWPEEGSLHAPSCDFFKSDGALSGRSLLDMGAIVQAESGTSIQLDLPLALDVSAKETAETSSDPREASASRRAVSLLGLEHYLWEQAKLNQCYRMRSRTWHICHARLREVLEDCTVNGQPLVEALYVVPPYRQATAAIHRAELAAFSEHLGQHDGRSRRGLILGEVKLVSKSPYGQRIDLRHLPRPLFARDRQLDAWRRSYLPAFTAAASEETARRVALVAVEQARSGVLSVVDAAFMLTTRNYIPADSSYEIRMADALAQAGRRLMKPLRYNHRDDVFPDFVLTDTDPVTYVEVYGVKGWQGYEARKRVKQLIYRRDPDVNLIEWEVDKSLPDLALPPASR
ncbi:DUF1173 family protein [Streptomyces sp. NPDC020883]|uniref:DUF1173 family protein n=1 Tax=Streptomyces sp. NPDC020883 TaxID=3365099 RepID=UPI0037BB6102